MRLVFWISTLMFETINQVVCIKKEGKEKKLEQKICFEKKLFLSDLQL